MRIGAMPGQAMPPVGSSGGADVVDRILAGDQAILKAAEGRRERTLAEKNEYSALSGMLGDLGKAVAGMRTPSLFRSLKVESSHPDIIEGAVTGPAELGSYELEVKGLAKADKLIEAGFPDMDQTPVGFGFMEIERDDGFRAEVRIDPGSTLKDVVERINSSESGVRATVVNTGFPEDPFRLMVASEATGEAARIHLDPDTTFLSTKKLSEGRNLDVSFDDVAITRATNEMTDLLSGLSLKAKRSEPGTRVQLQVTHDVEATAGTIKGFVDGYNKIAEYANQQFQVGAGGKPAGQAGSRGEVRDVMRRMQTAVSTVGNGSYRSLAEIGITTDAKTGALRLDEGKVRQALAKDYEGVTALFAATKAGEGLSGRLSRAIKGIKDPVHGSLTTRMKGIDRRIRDQDRRIEDQSRRLSERREQISQRLSQTNARIQEMESQAAYLTARSAQSSGNDGGGY